VNSHNKSYVLLCFWVFDLTMVINPMYNGIIMGIHRYKSICDLMILCLDSSFRLIVFPHGWPGHHRRCATIPAGTAPSSVAKKRRRKKATLQLWPFISYKYL